MIKVVVLGAGNVGSHLCKVLEQNPQVLLLQNYNRKGVSISGCHVPVTNQLSSIASAEVYIVTYTDNALLEVSESFKQLKGLVVHTSGATPMDVFNSLDNYGVFYPLQSFNKSIPVDFSNIPIATEANTTNNETLLLSLARSISTKVYKINSKQRNGLHVAAVFANNFSNFMYTQAKSICDEHAIDFSILKPLINDTIHKLVQKNPEETQTGPAIRKDSKTIERHLEIIKEDEQKELYTLLTKAIQKHYEKEL